MTRVLIAGVAAAITLTACSSPSPQPAPAVATDTVAHAVRPLEKYRNGLSDAERRSIYHLAQGGELIPLALFQSLERPRTPQDPAGTGLVPFATNLDRYGFIPDEKSDQNPFGLPVGMTVARSKLTNRLITGFNCTTCHVGEVWRDGRRVRIDGGPNMIRLNDMFRDFGTELRATIQEAGRRERFLAAVVRNKAANDATMPSDRSLKERMEELGTDIDLAKATLAYVQAMPTLGKLATVENGYGRVDAFGVARNLLFGSDPQNLRPMNAPVSFPHIWGIETTAWLQWGANMNSVMERNIGQSLGVGAVFDPKTFATTSRLDNLNTLEHSMYKLSPPQWPADVFGPVDQALAARGRPIYDRACANCHEKPFQVTPSGLVVYQLFSPKQTGISPLVAENFDKTVVVDGKTVRFADAAFGALAQLKRQYYEAHAVPEQTQAEWENRTRRPPPEWEARTRSTLAESEQFPDSRGGKVYPAKPLAGVWATAPYLDNGSVPTMWDLLTPPDARPKTFTLGSREYDAGKLGYKAADTPSPAPSWTLETSNPSNDSGGHVYGTTLSGDDKRALIEFLKVLKPGEMTKRPLR
jgi:hypothetical protein